MARYTLSVSDCQVLLFHECDRFLRYTSTPKGRRVAEVVPSVELDHSLVTKAILQGGEDWEERVLDEHLLDRLIVAEGEEGKPLSERRHSVADALEHLATMGVGDHL